MPQIPSNFNTGPNGVQTLVDESLTATSINGLATPGINSASQQTGAAESITDIGIDVNSPLPAIPDVSLTSGINTDSVFSLAGQPSPFGDLSISGLPDSLSNVFGSNFSIDDIAEQFGIGGLLGNLPINVDTNIAPKLDPSQNILHNFATHTYRITLGAQDIRDHQVTSDAEFKRGTPKITTMMMGSGGGKAVDGVERDPIFKEDFYVEDLKMTTIIGNSAQGNGSNTVGLSFIIYEPYAVSLIERLIALANKLGYPNYIKIPFIFKIEFIGYNDAGQQVGVVPLTTRYIPFQLTYMKFAIDGAGSKYECTGIPMNHMTFMKTVTAIPEAVEVAAGTLGEFFNGKPIPVGDGNNTIGGLAEAVNGYHRRLANTSGTDGQSEGPARNAADRIVIKVHPDIAEHKLEVANLSKVGMITETGEFNNPSRPAVTKPTYGFHAGTSIISIIRDMVTQSTFMTKQIEENKRIEQSNAAESFSAAEGRAGASSKCPIAKNKLVTPKITARYTMLEYDEKANRHAYQATYIVSPYESAGQQSPYISRSEIENIAKEYDYLFTGNNQDILDLDVKFDLAFYNNVASNTESVSEGTPSGNNKKKVGTDPGDCPAQQLDPLTMASLEARPVTESIGTASKEEIKKLKASALMKSIMQDSAGDMITLDLTILGDPDFIKQDDILYATDDDSDDAYTDNGAIKQDRGDMYLRLRFKAFDDIDHETGLRVEGRQIPDTGFVRKSTFDGFYRIMMIDSEFTAGTFTQKLVVVRTYTQETDDTESDTTLDSNLISFGADGSGFGEFGDFDAEAAASNAISSVTESAAQSVDEAQKLAGDFGAGRTPIDAGEFALVDESLIQNSAIATPVSSDDIVSLGSTTPLNADRRR